mgnify:CR=1 FL=1
MKDIVDPTNQRKSLDIQMLESYTSKSTIVTPKFSKSKKFCSICQSSTTTLPNTISLPTPKNGVVITHHNMKDADVIKRMLELNYIPCGKSTFYRYYKDYKEGKPIVNTK